ncbi:JAB domain-containing protein, partial [Enterococcus faecalis]|uniref:JAB domain-containing protein n=1 Tax=Enterococcus faecalis TaxID=1351 RepID=UPI00240E6C21
IIGNPSLNHRYRKGFYSLFKTLQQNLNVTKRLVEAGKLLDIEVLDHLVVNSDNGFTSLKERGYI